MQVRATARRKGAPWLGLRVVPLATKEQPCDPVGLPHEGNDTDAYDESTFSPGGLELAQVLGEEATTYAAGASETPSFMDVRRARADRQTMVRDFLANVTPQELAARRKNPHAPEHPETVLSCLRTILEEEWEHHRYAVRDLDTLAKVRSPSS